MDGTLLDLDAGVVIVLNIDNEYQDLDVVFVLALTKQVMVLSMKTLMPARYLQWFL